MKTNVLLCAVLLGWSAVASAGDGPPPSACSPLPFSTDVLTGNWNGERTWLADHGVVPSLSYIGEVLGNTTGGFRRAAIYEGLVLLSLDVDLQKLAGWQGLKFHVSGLDPHGAGLTQKALGDVGVVSFIDAYDGVRLDTLWVEQCFCRERFSFRVGVLAVDDEFYQTTAESVFVHANFAWPTVLGLNVPLATYPYGGLGARLKWAPSSTGYVMAGVYDGNPAAGVFHDPSPNAAPSTDFNKHGAQWALRRDEGAFLIAEAGLHYNDPPAPNASRPANEDGKQGVSEPRGLFTSIKLGAAYDTDTFSDAYDAASIALESPVAPARARRRGADWATYVQFDQEWYRERGTETQGLSAFLHGTYMPPDRNVYDFSAETGLVYTGLLPNRDDDLCGLGFSIIHASGATAAAARDASRAEGAHVATPDFEAVVEATYNAHVCPGVWLQPDVQFVIHPGASHEHGNALVIGLRATINF